MKQLPADDVIATARRLRAQADTAGWLRKRWLRRRADRLILGAIAAVARRAVKDLYRNESTGDTPS